MNMHPYGHPGPIQRTLTFVLCLFMAVGPSVSTFAMIGDEEDIQDAPPADPADPVDAGDVFYSFDDPSVAITAIPDGSGRITIALDDVLLEDAVRMFAQTTGANIITAGSLMADKRVTVSLQSVEWRPALRSILDLHQFALVESPPASEIFTIIPRLPDAPEPTQVQTFFLKYTTVSDVSPTIRSMLRGNATITTFPSRNAMVIRATEANLGEVDKLITELDVPGKQVLIEAKIVELTDEAAKQLGLRWDSLEAFNVTAGLGPFSRLASSVNKTDNINTRTASDGFTSVRTSRQAADIAREPLNTGVNPDVIGGDGGSHSSIRGYGTGAERFDYSDRMARNTSESIDSFSRQVSRAQSTILEMDSLRVVLSALEKMDGVSIVSNPKIIVSSGESKARFQVGDREPIIRTTRTTGTQESPGDKIVAELDTSINTEFIKNGYLYTGIELEVMATVKTDDFIEAYITPSLRRWIDNKVIGDNSWPLVNEKKISTTFTLRSGQTVAIGGLTDVQDRKQTTRVPYLGRIPVIGKLLFSHTRDVKKQVETIIFVTLSVADPDDLEHVSGIPEDSRLIHTRLLREQALRMEEEQKRREAEAALADKMSEGDAGPEILDQPMPRSARIRK